MEHVSGARICCRCKRAQSLADMYLQGGKLNGRCKPCQTEYRRTHYAANRDQYISDAKEWKVANIERARESARRSGRSDKSKARVRAKYWADPEASRAAYRTLRYSNLDSFREREAAYRAANRSACSDRIKEWKARNKTLVLAYTNRRRAQALRAIPAWADLDDIAAIYRTTGPGMHVDHIVPLINPLVCGLHCPANLRVTTAAENMRKGNRHWPDMP